MTEAQRFMRYVTPGLTFAVVALGLLLILIPDWTMGQLSALLKKDAGLSAVFATLLVSGGAGFLLSVIHHQLHWCSFSTEIDHSKLIRQLAEEGRIKFVDAATRKELTKMPAVDRRLAWIVLAALWHERLTVDSPLKAVDPRASRLTDLAHSAGTGRVASIAAYVTALIVACSVAQLSLTPVPIARFIVANVAAIMIIFIQHRNYTRICALAQGFIEQTLCDALGSTPVQASVVAIDPRAGTENA